MFVWRLFKLLHERVQIVRLSEIPSQSHFSTLTNDRTKEIFVWRWPPEIFLNFKTMIKVCAFRSFYMLISSHYFDRLPIVQIIQRIRRHEPYSFAYYIKCTFDDSLSKYVTYRGRDCSEKFIEILVEDARNIYKNNL